jgi:hypothetical protein
MDFPRDILYTHRLLHDNSLARREIKDCRERHKGLFVNSSFLPYVVFVLLELIRNDRTSGNTLILVLGMHGASCTSGTKALAGR